jgi:hypothetical protein
MSGYCTVAREPIAQRASGQEGDRIYFTQGSGGFPSHEEGDYEHD